MLDQHSRVTLSPQDYAGILRMDFRSFLERCFVDLNPATPYLHNWHIDLIAEKLIACAQGEIKRLIINVPPRSLKSLCASIAFPAFLLGHRPSAQVICASYGQDLADKLALDCRTIMASPWYQSVFPTRIASKKRSLADFMTTQQGGRMATSVGGVLTGRGADCIIIDDPLKPDEALSDTQRQAVNDWFDHTLYSRLNDKNAGCIILVMQRLHLDDLVGHVLEQENWEVVSFPAIAEQATAHTMETLLGPNTITRHTGDALHPERESLDTLQRLRDTLGEYHFSAQYQQAPVPLGGGLVKLAWLQRYAQCPEVFEHIVQSWDTANKSTELSDFSVCTTWGICQKKIYLLDVFRQRLNYPELKRAVKELATRYAPSTILIEDKASGTQLIQELNHEGLYAVKGIKPENDKVMRLHAQTAMIENGHVLLPEKAPWLDTYVLELTSFPKAKYNDQVDSTAQALQWIKQGMDEPAIMTYYRQQYEQLPHNKQSS